MSEHFEALILGLVQGVTEFLPVSSTAHLRIVNALIDSGNDLGAAYSAVIQLGSWAALIIYFRKDISLVIRDIFQGLSRSKWDAPGSRTALHLIVGTFPICLAGFLFSDWIRGPLRSFPVVAFGLITVGLWMWSAEYISSYRRGWNDMNWKHALSIGLAQCLALIPGASRSGTTLAMALMLHFNRSVGLRFSFLLSIPAIGLAGFYELVTEFHKLEAKGISGLFLGTAAACLSSYLCIAFFLRFVRSHSVIFFAVYRILLGIFILFFIGMQ